MEDITLDEFIQNLNLSFNGEMRGLQYIINVDNSNDFSKLFSEISMNDLLHIEDKSKASIEESEFRFTDGYFDVFLQADYNNDAYSCTIEER